MSRLKWHSPVLVPLFVLAVGGFFSAPALAQPAPDDAQTYSPMSPQDLQPLVGPVALYPDALLAEVLVAATYPDDIVAAKQWLDAGNDPNAIDDQDWDLSVKGVARYPDVLHYMAANVDWMNQLGDAFLNQQPDVMAAVQADRSEAMAAGNLASNDQQQVVTDGGTIEILPADPDQLYAPIYDPAVVYQPEQLVVGQPYVPLIRYGRGVRVGPWLHHDLDWDDRQIYVGDWGANRPWWHHENGHFDYTHDRPGLFRSNGNFSVNVHNRPLSVAGGAWSRQMHDPHKAVPRMQGRPAGREAYVRPGAGYAPRGITRAEPTGPLNYDHGSTVARESNRGRASIERSGIRSSAPVVREPARQAPTHREAPVRHAVPAPAIHNAPAGRVESHAAPERASSGAVSGYSNGAAAAHASERGAASRGGGGGGGARGRR